MLNKTLALLSFCLFSFYKRWTKTFWY